MIQIFILAGIIYLCVRRGAHTIAPVAERLFDQMRGLLLRGLARAPGTEGISAIISRMEQPRLLPAIDGLPMPPLRNQTRVNQYWTPEEARELLRLIDYFVHRFDLENLQAFRRTAPPEFHSWIDSLIAARRALAGSSVGIDVRIGTHGELLGQLFSRLTA